MSNGFREYVPIMDKPKVHKYLDSLGLVCYYYPDPSESESSLLSTWYDPLAVHIEKATYYRHKSGPFLSLQIVWTNYGQTESS